MKKYELSELVTQEAYRFQFEKMTLWEAKLALYIRPRPKWMPWFAYNWAVKLVFQQVEQKREINKIPGVVFSAKD